MTSSGAASSAISTTARSSAWSRSSLSLRIALAKLDSDPAAARATLAGAGDELALALAELRELARGLHPAVLTDRGLRAAVEMLAGRAPVPVEIADIPDERLPEPVEAAAYYLIAEALTNVAKYAHASTVRVRVAASDAGVFVEVSDDGVGGADPATGSGLRGLADRVEALGGSLDGREPRRRRDVAAGRDPAPDAEAMRPAPVVVGDSTSGAGTRRPQGRRRATKGAESDDQPAVSKDCRTLVTGEDTPVRSRPHHTRVTRPSPPRSSCARAKGRIPGRQRSMRTA